MNTSHDPLTPRRLFDEHFSRLYPEEARADLAKARSEDANPARNLALYRAAEAIGERFVQMESELFREEPPALDGTDASVYRLSRALTRARRDAWAGERTAEGGSTLSQVVLHGTMYVASCVVRLHGGEWLLRRPLWESRVGLRSAAGEAELSIFQWWLKALSDEEIERQTLGERYRAHVQVPTEDPEQWPVFVQGLRTVPELRKVRYDTLHKHLVAHVPELRDLGKDFPSAERLAELSLRTLRFALLGGGRMLLMHGQTAKGVHLIWLTSAGFYKAMFFPADDASDYALGVTDKTVTVELTESSRRLSHELLWWGP